ncbi:MAG TPA: fasciclin, partial [Algoriphagus sp.]|nr:fasciclin [Algoriphagus sp.]
MKKLLYLPSLFLALAAWSCGGQATDSTTSTAESAPGPGQSAVVDDVSNPNVVQVAISSA